MHCLRKIYPVFKSPVLWAFLLPILYWVYLSLTTQMVIVFDSLSYEGLGRRLYSEHWSEYFRTGPNREPCYPLLISAAMRLSNIFIYPYQTIVVYLQFFILFLSLFLTYHILKIVGIGPKIAAITILYLGFSPAIVNSALSLYSEIATYPTILLIVLISAYTWESISQGKLAKTVFLSILLGIFFLIITMTKAIFEIILPIFLVPFCVLIIRYSMQKNFQKVLCGSCSLLITLTIFQFSIFSYKSLNKTYNGEFTLTDRGPQAIYGNTARRMEPLTAKRLLIALAYLPGKGVCNSFFTEEECSIWSHKRSDHLGHTKALELTAQGIPEDQLEAEFIHLSQQEIFRNPFQYLLFCALEWIKMFFWESTKIGFVVYPPFLTNLFDSTLFKNGLRLFMFLLTFVAILYSIGKVFWQATVRSTASDRSGIFFHFVLFFVLVYLGTHSLFFTLTRYSLPIVPLLMIIIAHAINSWVKRIPGKNLLSC